jgi:hypothetical protein
MKIDFSIEHNETTFSDSIVLPDGQKMTDEEIESIKQARFQQWVEETTPSELEAD